MLACFFHFMKNIRKYLMQHNYTKNENAEKYKYIINNIYKLPFKKDINTCIFKEIKNNFLIQCVSYFKDYTLCLKEINIRFRTINSLENFKI